MKKKMVIIIGSLVLVIGLLALGMKMKSHQGYVLDTTNDKKTAISELYNVPADKIEIMGSSYLERNRTNELISIGAKLENQAYVVVFERIENNRYRKSYEREIEKNKVIFDDYHEVVIVALDNSNYDYKTLVVISNKFGSEEIDISDNEMICHCFENQNDVIHTFLVLDENKKMIENSPEIERVSKEDIESLN